MPPAMKGKTPKASAGKPATGTLRARDFKTGMSYPLGATVAAAGANFSLFSRSATGVELLLFDRADEFSPRRMFEEFTIVLRGRLQVETRDAVHQVSTGQAIWAGSGEWVRYSTPGPKGAEYLAVCMPAFSPETVHRDEQQVI